MPLNILSRSIPALLVALFITACGGGGGSGGGTTTPATTTITGRFVDATVVGISYKCGTSTTVSGTTNANGEFTCPTGQAVAFYVGDILVGSVPTATSLVTPLDLVGVGATPTNTTVANIVRFLMSISSSDPATGTITITPAVIAAAAGKTVVFTAVSGTAMDTLIPTLKSGATIYTAAQATAHVTSSINGLFAGNYAGTYSGAMSGTWSVTIAANGAVTGTADGSSAITGTMATTLSTGSTYGFTGTAGGTPWVGTLNISTKVFSGTWNDGAGSSGTWTGTTNTGGGSTTPTITSFTPTTGSVSTSMTISGTNLSSVTDVLFTGPSPSTAFVSGVIGTKTATSITTTIPASLAAGSYAVSVVHPGGEVAATSSLTVTAGGGATTPTLTGFSPATGAVGTTVTITGTNLVTAFPPAPIIKFDAFTATVTSSSNTSISVTVPTGLALGTYTLTIGGMSGTPLTVGTFTVTAAVVPAAPAAPTGVVANAFSATQINLSWTAVAGATGYNIYQSTSPGVVVSAANKVGTKTITYFSSTPLYGATPYYYVVTARNAVGESIGSAEVSATTRAIPVGVTAPTGAGSPDQVGNFQIVGSVMNPPLAGQIGIYVGVFTGTDGINVYRSSTPNVMITPTNLVNLRPIGINSMYGSTWSGYTDSGLAPGTKYYYRTTEVNAAGEGPGSTELIARTPLASVGAGAGLTLSPAFKGVAAIPNRIPYELTQGRVFTSAYEDAVSREFRFSYMVDAVNGDRLALTLTDTVGGVDSANLDVAVVGPSCAVTTAVGYPTCASLGITLDRVAGSIGFSSTPMKSVSGTTLGSVFNLSGTLNFTPF